MVTTGDANQRFKKPDAMAGMNQEIWKPQLSGWNVCVLSEFSDVKKYATCVKKNTIVIYMKGWKNNRPHVQYSHSGKGKTR